MRRWQERAARVLPAAGFGNFDANVFIARGDGSRIWDEDGREYIDYLISSGPMLLGHGHPEVTEAIAQQLGKGMTFFANNAAGVELAEVICGAVPCAEQLRYVSTGGEADMYAMRLARAATGRSKIIKFEGGYHGMSAEAQMSLAPTTEAPFPRPIPDSAGIPEAVAAEVLIAPFNDPEYFSALIAEYCDDIAGVIVEPLQRIVPPVPGFLQHLRDECTRYDAVLIFDEIVTGFRFHWGGAQTLYGVTPDLCTLGKVIGGGLPLAAIAGRESLMRYFDKSLVGDQVLMQVGTLSGNPLASVAGIKTLEILNRQGSYDQLEANGSAIMEMMRTHLGGAGVPHQIVGHPTLFDVVFTDESVVNYRDVQSADSDRAARFNRALREDGIFKSPGKVYPSLALTAADLEQTDVAIRRAAAAL